MVTTSDVRLSAEIATDANEHPASRFQAAGYWNERTENFGRRRIDAVRNALIDAGVPAGRIETGMLAAASGHDGAVQVHLNELERSQKERPR